MARYLALRIVLALLALTVTNPALAAVGDIVNKGFKDTGSNAGFVPKSGEAVSFTSAWQAYAGALAGMMGFLFLILAIYSGYLWIMARGNEDQVKKAKALLVGATIGLAIVVAARLIAEFVILNLSQTL